MIVDNLANVLTRIQQAARRANRDPAEITLVGVTKQQSAETMLAGYRAGLQHFGENRVEEIVDKVPLFLAETDPANPPVIHMIGHLQRRKVPQVLGLVQMIHSVDSVRLAERISRMAEQEMPILLECNISGEASKSGFAVADWESDDSILKAFLADVRTVFTLDHVKVAGLMTMAPFAAEAEETRPCFRSLRNLMSVCAEALPQIDWQNLSMGMTNDFEVAIEEGATMVRVGRAIFPRDA